MHFQRSIKYFAFNGAHYVNMLKTDITTPIKAVVSAAYRILVFGARNEENIINRFMAMIVR